MSKKLTQTLIEPLKLTEDQRKEFASELCELVGEIFNVKDYDRLYDSLVNPTPDVIKVRVFRNKEGKMVGYMKVIIDFGEYKGRKFAGFNSQAGFLRAYRGSSTTVLDGLKSMISFKLRHPSWDVYYCGIMVHPSSYSLFAKYGVEYWPRYDKPTPPEQEQRMIEIARLYSGDELVYNKEYPLTRMYYVGTHTLPQEQEYWKNSDKPTVQYFLKVNPRYTEGAGVFLWITMDLKFIRSAFMKFMGESIRKNWENTKAAAYRNSFGKKILPKPDVLGILRKIPTFEQISDEDLKKVSKTASVTSLRPGKYVIKAGDIGDSMYVIVQGSAYVLIHNEEGETIVDQFGAGDYFGEMSLMSGEPRTASVRTVSSTILVRIDRKPFLDFLENNPEIKSIAWDVFGQRRFDKYLIGQERFEHLDHDSRIAWYQSAERKFLNKGTEQKISASKYVFMITGSAEVKQGENWLSIKAPALLKFGGDWILKASTESRIGLLDEYKV